jgi:hypothetical protein
MIRDLSDDELPSSRDINFDIGWQSKGMTDAGLNQISER